MILRQLRNTLNIINESIEIFIDRWDSSRNMLRRTEEEAEVVETEAEPVEEEAFEAEELEPVEEEPEVIEPEEEETEDRPLVTDEPEVIEENTEDEPVEEEPEPIEPVANSFAEGYGPIVLVPAEPQPAEAEPVEVETPVVENVEPVLNLTPTVSVETSVSSPKVSSASIKEHVVESESKLVSSSYYVQIATLAEEANIQNLLDQYAKYPIVLVPTASGAYKVLVGPLSVDEYGVVLAKFKAAGFKDAFVKKM